MFLPDKLIESWKVLLEKNSLLEMAEEEAPDGFIGGMSKQDTDKHLAWRYDGSCARTILSILDPREKLSAVSDAYASIFAGNKVFVADIPSGSGAAIVSIICTLYELRKESVIPRHPLQLNILAGEISESARNYVFDQLNYLKSVLEEQAIWIEFEIMYWNVLDKISTADLIKEMTLMSQSCSSSLIVLSNFSGFLQGEGKWNEAKPQFDNIFLHSRGISSTAIWIEPQTNKVIPFFSRLLKWFKTSFKSLIGKKIEIEDPDWYAQAEVFFTQPIKNGHSPVRLTVIRFDLPAEAQP